MTTTDTPLWFRSFINDHFERLNNKIDKLQSQLDNINQRKIEEKLEAGSKKFFEDEIDDLVYKQLVNGQGKILFETLVCAFRDKFGQHVSIEYLNAAIDKNYIRKSDERKTMIYINHVIYTNDTKGSEI
jgi:hypothetical protein